METVSGLARVDTKSTLCRERSFLGASSTTTLKPALISKTVSEDSLSSSGDHVVHNTARPVRERENQNIVHSKFRADESVPYPSAAYQQPLPPYILAGPAHHHDHSLPISIHNGHPHNTPYYLPHPVHHLNQVPYGYVFVPFQEPPRILSTILSLALLHRPRTSLQLILK
jgi:hypothetical protein